MQWPSVPTCHGEQSSVFKFGVAEWAPADGGRNYRHCSYCGCVHPEDLLRLVAEGAKLGGSDWKYGWPHKFYVNNPHGKWYNEHLQDEGYDKEALDQLLALLKDQTQIEFTVEGSRLGYRAPYDGYQASGL
jgi:hypothetical protein